jgi:hypothetical protein
VGTRPCAVAGQVEYWSSHLMPAQTRRMEGALSDTVQSTVLTALRTVRISHVRAMGEDAITSRERNHGVLPAIIAVISRNITGRERFPRGRSIILCEPITHGLPCRELGEAATSTLPPEAPSLLDYQHGSGPPWFPAGVRMKKKKANASASIFL